MKKREKREKKEKILLPPKQLKRKRRAVKFWISFFIILILAIVVFFAGWIKPNLANNQLAIISNKIKNSRTVYTPNKFLWEITGIVPGNISIEIYNTQLHDININRSGSLPSGAFYARYVQNGKEDDFNFSIDMDLVYEIWEDKIIELSQNKVIEPVKTIRSIFENLQKPATSEIKSETEKTSNESVNTLFYKNIESQITNEVYTYITQRSNQEDFIQKFAIDFTDLEEEIKNFVEKNHPEIRIITIVNNELLIPDYDLYKQIKELVRTNLTPISAAEISNQISEDNEVRLINANRIDALTELGKVLTEFPVLMDYLKINSETAKNLELLKFQE